MTKPQLLFAGPNGQSSVRAIFDQPMRQLDTSAPEDPQNPANWTPGGGLPAITSVLRTSDVEFELILASPAPVAAGYTVTVSTTVESAEGEVMDPGFLTPAPFAVTAADADLVVSSIVWTTDATIDITFSEPIAQITFDAYHEVAQFLAQDRGSREPSVIGFSQSGAVATLTIDNPGTAGANYLVSLNREVFVSSANNTTLLAGEEDIPVYGQGLAPTIASLSVDEDDVEVTASEVLGEPPGDGGWVLSHGLYEIDLGTLGPSTPLELGSTPAILNAPGANLNGETGNTATFSISKVTRTITAGSSFVTQASSALGAGTEATGAGTTTLSKTSGDPYELVFSGGSDSLTRAGRRFDTTLELTSFTPGATSFPLIAFTLLNTQTSVVMEKTVNDLAVLKLYRGNQDLGLESVEFDPTTAFALSIIDATSDTNGFLAIEIDGLVVLGAPAKDVLDDDLTQSNTGSTALAVTLGHPGSPTEVFDIEFSADIVTQSYLGQGFLGLDSNDLFSFAGSAASATVGAAVSPPPSSGYQGTGKGAFGVHAEYLPEVNAIQVVIGLNTDALPNQFTGSITLLTGTEHVLDQVLFDQTCMLVGDAEIFVVFLNPKCWSGTLVSASLTIDGVDYSTTVGVTELGVPPVLGSLAPQPAKWYHQRLNNRIDDAASPSFGPSAIINTPRVPGRSSRSRRVHPPPLTQPPTPSFKRSITHHLPYSPR
jgi:hypothetical protein